MARWLKHARRRAGFQLFRALAFACMLLGGLPLAGRCGAGLGELHYRFAARQRRDLERQLAQLFPDTDAATLRARLRQAYRAGDRAVFEASAMGCRRVPEKTIRDRCEFVGLERLQASLSAGRGAILLGMHMGNGLLMTARLAAAGLPVSVVFRESRKTAGGVMARCMRLHGMEGIPAGQRSRAYRDMARALQRGGIVFVLMDQASKHGGVPVEFLGKHVELPAGPFRLAQRSGAPVLTAFATAAEPNWRFEISAPLDLGAGDDATAAAVVARAMESHIRAHPGLWTWHHRRWRRYPFLVTNDAQRGGSKE